ncbi:NAD-P-binding protein [Trametes maxima]|nr:NAD-P-binding protein [Trametes maxima]
MYTLLLNVSVDVYVVAVTGTSSGFGRETVVQLLNAGEKVVATLRKPEVLADLTKKYPVDRLRVIKLDVTKPAEIKAAFAAAKAAFGRIDVVFNNAGYVAIGESEGFPDDVARPLFEVNFWGAVHVSQEAVRFFREENKPQGGLLLQNSAMVGVAGVPVISFYTDTKHALEGWSEALAKEVDPAWNIKVTIVEPGAFKTSVFDKGSMVVVPQHPAYNNPALPVWNFRGAFIKGSGDHYDTPASMNPADAAKAVAKIIEVTKVANPPLRFVIGKDSIGLIREKVKSLTADVDAYESWSENLA